MAYADPSDLEDLLPDELLVEAADDDADGTADSGRLASLIAAAERAINGRLARRFAVPIDVTAGETASAAAWLKNATIYLAVGIAYKRRGLAEQCPYKDEIAAIDKELTLIANGEQPLYPTINRVNDSAAIISEASKVHSSQTNT